MAFIPFHLSFGITKNIFASTTSALLESLRDTFESGDLDFGIKAADVHFTASFTINNENIVYIIVDNDNETFKAVLREPSAHNLTIYYTTKLPVVFEWPTKPKDGPKHVVLGSLLYSSLYSVSTLQTKARRELALYLAKNKTTLKPEVFTLMLCNSLYTQFPFADNSIEMYACNALLFQPSRQYSNITLQNIETLFDWQDGTDTNTMLTTIATANYTSEQFTEALKVPEVVAKKILEQRYV